MFLIQPFELIVHLEEGNFHVHYWFHPTREVSGTINGKDDAAVRKPPKKLNLEPAYPQMPQAQ